MVNFVIHIGRHKTGTTTLQHTFLRTREELSRDGFLYPRAGAVSSGVAHHKLAFALKKVKNNSELQRIILELKDELKEHHHTIILSSEAFQNCRDFNSIQRFLDDFNPTSVTIVSYFREYVDYVISTFKQNQQAQTTYKSLSECFEQYLNIQQYIENWNSVGDIDFCWLDRGYLKDNDLIADFRDKAGLPEYFKSEVNKNSAIGGNLLFAKLWANYLGKEFLGYNKLSELSTKHASYRESFYFSDENAHLIRKTNQYNAVLEGFLGKIEYKSWEHCGRFPNLENWNTDIKFFNMKDKCVDLSWLIDNAPPSNFATDIEDLIGSKTGLFLARQKPIKALRFYRRLLNNLRTHHS